MEGDMIAIPSAHACEPNGPSTPPAQDVASKGLHWLRRYAELADAMYEIRRNCLRLSVLGVSTLHPRHPIPPDQLRLLGFGGPRATSAATEVHHTDRVPLPSRATLVRRWAWCVLFACRDVLDLCRLRIRFGWRLRRCAPASAAILLKTWCFGPQSLQGASDFYYGTLPQRLRARGISAVLLCGDTRGRFDASFAQAALRWRDLNAVPESLLAPIGAPLVIALGQLRTALRLRRMARQSPDPDLAALAATAARESMTPIVMRNTLQCWIARAAVKRWGAAVFVTFYEGQPWEQPAWHGAKAADPACVTVGYQHTIIMPHSLSLLSPNRDSWERSAPDVVLCLGTVTRDMMRPGHAARGSYLVPFGTFRRATEGLDGVTPQPHRRTVLVLPEGRAQPVESRILFTFAMRLAEEMPDHRFIFRCHPSLPFDRVRPHLSDVAEQYPNIEVSEREPIGVDFDRASVILYRGSSAVLYAVLRGLKPVYLHDEAHPDIDPLFELTGWREPVTTLSEAAELLTRYAGVHEAVAAEAWRPAADYVNAYTVPVTEASISRFLSAVGLADGKADRG